RACGGALDAHAAERARQRIADEDALARHQHALPVRLDERLAGEIPCHHDAGLGKFRAVVARLAARAVAAGGAGGEPVERARLPAVEAEDAAERREVVGDRAVADMHSTGYGRVQASAYACTSAPTATSSSACTRRKSPRPIVAWPGGKRTWTIRPSAMPRFSA